MSTGPVTGKTETRVGERLRSRTPIRQRRGNRPGQNRREAFPPTKYDGSDPLYQKPGQLATCKSDLATAKTYLYPLLNSVPGPGLDKTAQEAPPLRVSHKSSPPRAWSNSAFPALSLFPCMQPSVRTDKAETPVPPLSSPQSQPSSPKKSSRSALHSQRRMAP